MDLGLTFANSRISGDGIDDIGKFAIQGGFDRRTGECHWHKDYIGGHQVYYVGCRENRGIWGIWEIGRLDRGGFHIWPLADGKDFDQSNEEQVAKPVPEAQPVVMETPPGRCATAPSDGSGRSARPCR